MHRIKRVLDEYLPFWLSQASYWISSEFQREVALAGFTFAEWRTLASLYGGAGETVGTLSRLALMKQPTLSKLVRRLEADGLVERCSAEGDRRQTRVFVTDKGGARVAALVEGETSPAGGASTFRDCQLEKAVAYPSGSGAPA